MEEKLCALFVISGLAVLCPWVSGSISDVRVKPGDNITVVCDCACPTGVYTVWYRISQQNQPTLVLTFRSENQLPNRSRAKSWMNPYPRFLLLKNTKSNCYNLHITNITESDEGLYFCGTETTDVVEVEKIDTISIYSFGNATTRILFEPSEHADPCPKECGVCWTLLYALCPALTLLSALLLIFLLYSDCHKQGMKRADTSVQMSQNEDEDVCYAALEIRQASQRPKRKKKATDNSDFSTYSAIKTSQ